jgi:hypothetical protein
MPVKLTTLLTSRTLLPTLRLCLTTAIMIAAVTPPPADARTYAFSEISREYAPFTCKRKLTATTFTDPLRQALSMTIVSEHWYTENGAIKERRLIRGTSAGIDYTLFDFFDIFTAFNDVTVYMQSLHYAIYPCGYYNEYWLDETEDLDDCQGVDMGEHPA